VQTLLSLHVVPPASGVNWHPVAGLQESVVHGFPSLQVNGWCTQPVGTTHPSEVQASPSLQFSEVPAQNIPVGPPSRHLSFCVQTLPSSHAVPTGAGVPTQRGAACPGASTHTSPDVQGLPSSHAAPTARGVLLHCPVAGSHASTVQTLLSLQLTAAKYWHAPVPGLHWSTVQKLPSSQLTALPTHCPAWHASAVVHSVLSAHGVSSASGVNWHPVPATHASCVHGF
jgi:hypothetical protein